jgi:hypothetical protein
LQVRQTIAPSQFNAEEAHQLALLDDSKIAHQYSQIAIYK